MVYGIILLYYEKNAENALINFKEILDDINIEYKMIIVTNNADLKLGMINLKNGDNSNAEFSGWDKGISLIDPLQDDDFFIFCNDTFCHHRRWSAFEKEIFVNALNKGITSDFQGIIGEVDTHREQFSILGITASSWVSTYLFGMSSKLLIAHNNKLSLSEGFSKRLIIDVNQGKIFWGDGVSNSLKRRIENWLDPDNMLGWYNRNSPDDIRLKKIRSILNEMYLSAFCQKQGFELRDVYSNLSWYKALRVRILKLMRFCKVLASNFFSLN